MVSLSNSEYGEADTDGEGPVYLDHDVIGEPAHPVPEPPLIEGADLFQQDETVSPERRILGADRHMNRKPGLAPLGRDGRHDHGRAVLVADVVLEDEDRADSTLLRAYDR